MIRLSAVTIIIILFISCSPGKKSYRSLTKEATLAVKTAKKQWGNYTDAYRVIILTNYGEMVVRLYNETPLHRDNFIEKVKSGFYNNLLFHRVIKDFMIQGGDPQSREAASGQRLGNGEAEGSRIPAEIRTAAGIYHKKGILAAARDNNPEKASSNCQFYIAQGKIFTPGELENAARQRGFTLSPEQKQLYTTVGGIPHLDGNYTVYGELESGWEVLDKIADTKTGYADRPMEDIRMFMFIVSEKQ